MENATPAPIDLIVQDRQFIVLMDVPGCTVSDVQIIEDKNRLTILAQIPPFQL